MMAIDLDSNVEADRVKFQDALTRIEKGCLSPKKKEERMKKVAVEFVDAGGKVGWLLEEESGAEIETHYESWPVDTLKFGYLRWHILAKSDDNKAALVIATYILEDRPYQTENEEAFARFGEYFEDLTWAESEIREYLNGEFIEKHFSRAEASRIIPSQLHNDANRATGAGGGDVTVDRVFLLSLDEARKYSSILGCVKLSDETMQWWLRSPAESGGWPAFVLDWWDEPREHDFPLICDGVDGCGDGAGVAYGIRPAMWIELEEGVEGADVCR